MPSPGITKRMMADVMKTLMTRRPVSKISVGEIVDECGLNRNSFYYHFRDKYDLVNWIFYTDFVVELGQQQFDTSWEFMECLCRFFQKDRLFYLHALEDVGQNSFSEYVKGITRDALLIRSEDQDIEYMDFYVSFFVDAYLATIRRWLTENNEMSPEALTSLIKKAATGAAMRVLDQADPE